MPGLLGVLYGLYAWTVFIALCLLGLAAVWLPLRLVRRRALVRRLARLILALTGLRPSVRGLGRLPQPCVVVANHSSYLDGVILAAVLPPVFSFVIKREMSGVPLAGPLLRRIGVEFVERRDPRRGARDARRLLRNATRGDSLAFFPEGTFGREIGLLRFHIGAFAAAARAGMPVVPLAIRGARERLPPGSLWPRPGTLQLELLPAVQAPTAGAEPSARAQALRDGARRALLAALGEPDLCAGDTGPVPRERIQ